MNRPRGIEFESKGPPLDALAFTLYEIPALMKCSSSRPRCLLACGGSVQLKVESKDRRFEFLLFLPVTMFS